jgi:glucosamine-6-phosphate deaminase
MQSSQFKVEKLKASVYPDRKKMGAAVAKAVASKMSELQSTGQVVRIIFAAAPSQDDFLSALIREENIDWKKVIAFHMDDYIGLSPESDQSFRYYLEQHLFNHVQCGEINFIDKNAPDAEQECKRYATLLNESQVHIVCLGIGENGHIAFNDPPVADFDDQETVKVVELDQECRQQQVNDGCFPTLYDVPTHAITLSLPALMSGQNLYCTVPGPRKANAVYKALNDPISTDCPATILRQHENMELFLDNYSAGQMVDIVGK